MLTISHLTAGYSDLEILHDVSLTLPSGQIGVLMGPNGAGKSTLLKSIYGLTDLAMGKITYRDEEITRLAAHELLSRGIAYVPQGRINFRFLSIEENLRLGAHSVRDASEVSKRLDDVYRQFPVLKDRAHDLAFALSGGQQQMLAIGRALMSAPTLLLMDEPSLGLAPKIVKEMFEHIKTIRDQFGTTILIVEHNIKSLLDMADLGFILVQGSLVATDTCANLKNDPIMQKVFVGTWE